MIGPVTTTGVHPVRLRPSGVEVPAPPRRSSGGIGVAADAPPIDASRVATLRAAIADGSYVVDPHAIAARMIEGDLSDR